MIFSLCFSSSPSLFLFSSSKYFTEWNDERERQKINPLSLNYISPPLSDLGRYIRPVGFKYISSDKSNLSIQRIERKRERERGREKLVGNIGRGGKIDKRRFHARANNKFRELIALFEFLLVPKYLKYCSLIASNRKDSSCLNVIRRIGRIYKNIQISYVPSNIRIFPSIETKKTTTPWRGFPHGQRSREEGEGERLESRFHGKFDPLVNGNS